jgi:small subunit ribosomal protein S17e
VNSDLSFSHEGEILSVKQKYIKRTALEIMKQHGDKVTLDFKANREILDANSTIQGKLLRNRIAGYMVRLKKRESKPKK